MADKIAICGFGRIGRCVTRAALANGTFVPAAIADVQDLNTLAALFSVDTDYGCWPEPVSVKASALVVGDYQIEFLNATRDELNWGSCGVGVVVDCTGRATARAGAQAHLERGAKRVLVSAPPKTRQDCDAVLLPGINLDTYDPTQHRIISMASCTTNALAPVVKVLLGEPFGIRRGFFSTVHAYTATQALIDAPLKDRRDSWAAARNIVPSSSGAAKALQYIWPDLVRDGNPIITGKAYRVPVSTGSIVELNVELKCSTSDQEVRDAFRQAATNPPLAGIMGILEEEYASCRIVGEKLSCIVDLPLVQVLESSLVSVAAWYDNQYGYACRLAELAAAIA